jgi:hypothetical protein
MKSLRLGACLVICATFLVSGCAGANATVTGTLEGSDGACLYLLVSNGNATDRYWLRRLPSGYDADERGLSTPDGRLIRIGSSLTVSGVLSSMPFERQCAGAHTLDATASGS